MAVLGRTSQLLTHCVEKKNDCDPCKLFLSLETDTDPGCECQIEHSYERFQWWGFFFFPAVPYFYLLLRSPLSHFCPVG